jgi:hypothetical protein
MLARERLQMERDLAVEIVLDSSSLEERTQALPHDPQRAHRRHAF